MQPSHIAFRLSAQRALVTHVVAALRCVSLGLNDEIRRCDLRFCFERDPSDAEREACSIAATEIVSDFPDWDIVDVIEVVGIGQKPERLEWTVYHRCEDDWVSSAE